MSVGSLLSILECAATDEVKERLMRMVCYIGYADEVSENTYAANSTTAFCISKP